MTIDAAFAALVEANPIPDPRSYAEHRLEPAAFLTATRERTTDMQSIDQQESEQKAPQRKRQALAAVAAFVLVIAVGVASALALRGGNEVTNVPAPPFDTPQQALEAYYSALNGGDGEAYLALFTEDSLKGGVGSSGTASDDKIRARVESTGATGIITTVVSCTTETELRSKCIAITEDPSEEIIFGILELQETSVVVNIDESGRIARIGENTPPHSTIDTDRADAWGAWFTANEPELAKEQGQLWGTGSGSDPLERSGADIGRDMKSALERFDAQYEG